MESKHEKFMLQNWASSRVTLTPPNCDTCLRWDELAWVWDSIELMHKNG